jgi:hypothetical protein
MIGGATEQDGRALSPLSTWAEYLELLQGNYKVITLLKYGENKK